MTVTDSLIRPELPVALRPRQTPSETLAEAKERAMALMDLVRQAHISVTISGREYLKVEAWQTLARFNNCWIDTEWTRDLRDAEGEVIGVEARARLVQIETGHVLGGAEGACMMDEELTTREGQQIERWSDYYAIRSMAQTRAQSKVGRMAFAWIAVLAGYEATPAEEMTGMARDQRMCPHCGKATIIKGKEEYGGGWICFKKKGGCGAKFATLEDLSASGPGTPQAETGPAGKEQEAHRPDPQPVSPSGSPITAAEMRSILLGKISGLADKKKLVASARADLWAKFCLGATPETVDVAALQDLYAFMAKIQA